jgi:hypothetical protein
LENHVHRTPRLGNHGLLNVRIGINSHYPAMGAGDPEGRIDRRRLYDDYEHWQRA